MKIMSVFTLACRVIILSIYLCGVGHAATIDALCISERDFTNTNTMDLAAIRAWLNSRGGFLKGTKTDGTPFTFTDVDGKETDPAQEIFDAAVLPYYDSINSQWLPGMNPQVLLTTLYKEKPAAFTLTARPSNSTLKNLAGLKINSPSARDQIQKAALTVKRNFHAALSHCKTTNNGWQVDAVKLTGEPNPGNEITVDGNPIPVFPENKAVATLYSYTPWVGPAFGGGLAIYDTNRNAYKARGGNGYFCELWKKFGWEVPAPSTPIIGPSASPNILCRVAAPNKCVSLNVAGGTGPYQWTASQGTVTATGNGRNIQLRPPPNPGAWRVGTMAYAQAGLNKSCGYPAYDNGNPPNPIACFGGIATQYCNSTAKTTMFDCADNVLWENADTAWACGFSWGVTPTLSWCSSAQGNQPVRGTCSFALTNCNGKNYNKLCTGWGVELFTDTKDWSGGLCNPCGISMQGATVTVRDQNGVGTPVTVPITIR